MGAIGGRSMSNRFKRRRAKVDEAASARPRGLATLLAAKRLPQTLTVLGFWVLHVLVLASGMPRIEYDSLGGVALMVMACHVAFGWYMSLFHRKLLRQLRSIVIIEMGVLCCLLVGRVLLWFELPPYALPMSVIAVAFAIGFNEHIAVVWALLMAVVLGVAWALWQDGWVSTIDLAAMATLGAGALVGIFSLYKVSRRSKVVAAAIYIGLAKASMVLIAEYLLPGEGSLARLEQAGSRPWALLLFAGGSGLFAGFFLAEIGLRLIEMVFDVATDVRLYELTDLNHPVLKKFALEAPGTFHHSQMMGMLVESAAEVIGANALLCRVGCHFHDIGKILKPEYYVENMRGGTSKHEGLTPTMSTLIIISHVKDGVEIAAQLGLPSRVIACIPEHHGTIAVEYFYRQALAHQQKHGGPPVSKDDFRYPGPKPQSRETAILMIADTVEAMVRVVDDPNPSRIDALVQDVIRRRLVDGQFDECGITMAELHLAKEAMVRVLLGLYHSRIKYPKVPTAELKAMAVMSGDDGSSTMAIARTMADGPGLPSAAGPARAGQGGVATSSVHDDCDGEALAEQPKEAGADGKVDDPWPAGDSGHGG